MTEFVFESDYLYHTSFTEATVVQKQNDPWFTPQKLCQETCCAESVAISLDQDYHHIINTLDGPDLADVLLQQYPNNDSAIQFFGAQMNLAMLPCFQPGTIIHVDNHVMLLEYFFRYWRPNITVPYILITSESDSDSPAVFEDKLSTDPLLIKWFGQSLDASRIPQDGKDKFEGLPLGLSKFHDQDRYLRRYLELTNFTNPFANDRKERWTKSVLMTNRYSIDVQAVDPVNVDEDFYKILFVKFNIEHASEKRKALYDSLCSGVNQTKHRMDEFSCSTVSLYPYQVYQAASSYLFGMSPEGMGWDCFRTYELLLLGVIPVVAAKRGGLHGLFDGMPVLVLEHFDRKRTRAEYLQVFREYIASPSFQNTDYEAGWNRLFLRHWRRKMLHVAGRDAQILKDPVTGKEYYQAWKYTSPTPMSKSYGVPKEPW